MRDDIVARLMESSVTDHNHDDVIQSAMDEIERLRAIAGALAVWASHGPGCDPDDSDGCRCGFGMVEELWKEYCVERASP